jgi:hypothetical protein
MKRLVAFLVVLFFTSPLLADQIPLGLRWDKVFVQEYWKDGKPYYAIANIGDRNAIVWTTDGAGKWKVKAGQIARVAVQPGQNGALFRFMIDQQNLGLLQQPVTPKQPVKDGYATYLGLNGSGGGYQDLYCVQKEFSFPSGGIIEIDLIVPSKRGTITFWKQKRNDYPLPQALIIEAKCATLPVTDTGGTIVIDANKPLKDEPTHTVLLKFRAPMVQRKTMVIIDGNATLTQGGAHGITRGVVVDRGQAAGLNEKKK